MTKQELVRTVAAELALDTWPKYYVERNPRLTEACLPLAEHVVELVLTHGPQEKDKP